MQKKVERYFINDNSWKEIADINVPRASASSCCHRDYIYLFCGLTGKIANHTVINTIERMSLTDVK